MFREHKHAHIKVKEEPDFLESKWWKNVLNTEKKFKTFEIALSGGLGIIMELHKNNIHYLHQCCEINLLFLTTKALPEYQKRLEKNPKRDYTKYITECTRLRDLISALMQKLSKYK